MIDPDFAPEFQRETRVWGRIAAVIWSVFFLLWVVLFALIWWPF